MAFLMVALGGVFGAVSRYLLTLIVPVSSMGVILLINIFGSVLMGSLYKGSNDVLWLLLAIGFCGAFTTFSTYSLDNIKLLLNGEWGMMFFYGIGIANKLKAYKLQEQGADTVEANEKLGFDADLRDYGVGAQMMLDLNLTKLRLITNNPKKIIGLKGYGLEVVERVPIEITAGKHNKNYLSTKASKLGHMLKENG